MSALTQQRPPFVTLALGLFISWAETMPVGLCFVYGSQTQIMKIPWKTTCFLNFQGQKTKTPWLLWPLALDFVVMVSQPIENSRSKDKAPAVVFLGGFSPECDNWYFDAWDHC